MSLPSFTLRVYTASPTPPSITVFTWTKSTALQVIWRSKISACKGCDTLILNEPGHDISQIPCNTAKFVHAHLLPWQRQLSGPTHFKTISWSKLTTERDGCPSVVRAIAASAPPFSAAACASSPFTFSTSDCLSVSGGGSNSPASLLLAVTLLVLGSWSLSGVSSLESLEYLEGVVLCAFCLANCTSIFPRDTGWGLISVGLHSSFLFRGVRGGDCKLACSADLASLAGLLGYPDLFLAGKISRRVLWWAIMEFWTVELWPALCPPSRLCACAKRSWAFFFFLFFFNNFSLLSPTNTAFVIQKAKLTLEISIANC